MLNSDLPNIASIGGGSEVRAKVAALIGYARAHGSATSKAAVKTFFQTAVAAMTPPANTVVPAITGTAKVGTALSSSTGTFSDGGALVYQWQYNNGTAWIDIPGANAATFTPAEGHVGLTLRVRVTTTTIGGTASGVSLPTSAVAAAA